MTTEGPATTRHHTTAAGPVARGDDWRTHAACLNLDPNFMFGARHRSESLHICRRHCPVLAQCEAHARRLRPAPTDCVMGGIAWRMYADRLDHTTADPAAAGRCRRCTPAGTP